MGWTGGVLECGKQEADDPVTLGDPQRSSEQRPDGSRATISRGARLGRVSLEPEQEVKPVTR